MDFFSQQEHARRQTNKLIFYFLAAVLLIVLLLNLIGWMVLGVEYLPGNDETYHLKPLEWFSSPMSIMITITVLAVIAGISLFRMYQLRGNGQRVAEWAGAVPLDLVTRDLKERTFINVVEELAIASGVPIPKLYILPQEQGINAFVAGSRPGEAIMVITRGALMALNRRELQGVVGHEFSHILNGDMRLNIKLMGVLAGILVIGQTGLFLVRSQMMSGSNRSSDSKTPVPLIVVALLIAAVGYIGLFFGRLIKAAVSRQREFLADASAVQFTRDNEGIVSALKKIQDWQYGSTLSSNHAEEVGHLCFGESLKVSLSQWLSTHPPLDDRIAALTSIKSPPKKSRQGENSKIKAENGDVVMSGFIGQSVTVEQVMGTIGQPRPQHLDYAQQLHATLPQPLLQQLRQPKGALALLYFLLMPTETKAQQSVLNQLEIQTDQQVMHWLKLSLQKLALPAPEQRLALFELALPALTQLNAVEKQVLIKQVDELIMLDQQVSLFERILNARLHQSLDLQLQRPEADSLNSFDGLDQDIALLLSSVAQAGGGGSAIKIQAAYERALRRFTAELIPQTQATAYTPQQFSTVLHKLSSLTPDLRRQLFESCVDCVLYDGVVEWMEAEVLRAIAESLDCPMPPMLKAV